MDKKEFIIKIPEKKWASDLKSNSIFVFDACALLSVYSFTDVERKNFFSILKKLADKNRIWMPYQFLEEFEIHRLQKIQDQFEAYTTFKNIIDAQFKLICENQAIHNFGSHKFFKKYKEKFLKRIKDIHNKIVAELQNAKSKHPDWRLVDPVKKALMKCFIDKIGQPYSEEDERYKDIIRTGGERYKKFIPPGYMDTVKNRTDLTNMKQFGDLIAWFQIMDFAKICKKTIVIVTLDEKEDWWNKQGGKFFGPRIELMYEIYDYAGVHLDMFDMKDFLKYAKEKLAFIIHDDLIEKINKIENENQNQNEDGVSNQNDLTSQEASIEQNISTAVNEKESEISN